MCAVQFHHSSKLILAPPLPLAAEPYLSFSLPFHCKSNRYIAVPFLFLPSLSSPFPSRITAVPIRNCSIPLLAFPLPSASNLFLFMSYHSYSISFHVKSFQFQRNACTSYQCYSIANLVSSIPFPFPITPVPIQSTTIQCLSVSFDAIPCLISAFLTISHASRLFAFPSLLLATPSCSISSLSHPFPCLFTSDHFRCKPDLRFSNTVRFYTFPDHCASHRLFASPFQCQYIQSAAVQLHLCSSQSRFD